MNTEKFYTMCCKMLAIGWYWQTIKTVNASEVAAIGETTAFEIYSRAQANTPRYW